MLGLPHFSEAFAMRFHYARTHGPDDLVEGADWLPYVEDCESARDAAERLIREHGFFAPWGGQCWLHVVPSRDWMTASTAGFIPHTTFHVTARPKTVAKGVRLGR
jgi:hypothetical protein